MSQDHGERLVAFGLITPAQLGEAFQYQQMSGLGFTAVIEILGFAEARDIAQALWPAFPFLDLDSVKSLARELSVPWPGPLAQRYRLVPVSQTGNMAVVGITDPQDAAALHAFRRQAGFEPDPRVVSFLALGRALSRIYGIKTPSPGWQDAECHNAEWQHAARDWRNMSAWDGGAAIRASLAPAADKGLLEQATVDLLSRLHNALSDLYGYETGDVMCYLPAVREDTPKSNLEQSVSDRINACRSNLLRQAGFLRKHTKHLDSETAVQLREHIADQISLLAALEGLAERVGSLKGEDAEAEVIRELGAHLDATLKNPPAANETALEAAGLIVAWRPHL